MAQTLQTGLHIKGLTADTNTLLVSGSSVDDVFVVKNDGKVGVGTISPTENLDVSGKTKTQNLQITSGATNLGYVLTASDSLGNTEWRFFSGITSVVVSSPMSGTTGLNPVISVQDAKADDLTKGVAAFTSSDFNDNGSGLISIDYVNGQSASGSTKGFLTSSDWNVFNNKQNLITLTTTGTTQAASFNQTTGALNIPQYGGAGGSSLGHNLMFGFGGTGGQTISSNRTYSFGANFISTAIIVSGTSATADRPSRRLLANKTSTITKASVITVITSPGNYASPSSATMQIIVRNVTSGTSITIDSAFPIGGGAIPANNGWFSRTSPSVIVPNRNVLYSLGSGLSVTQGDQIQIRLITPSWTSDASPLSMYVSLFFE
jgi:hypothetical protein